MLINWTQKQVLCTTLFSILLLVIKLFARHLLLCFRIFLRTRCDSLRPLTSSVHGLSYHDREGDAGVIASVSKAQLSLRFPTTSNPHFCRVEFVNIRYYSPTASGRCDRLVASIRFPGLDQSWCSAHADGLAIRIMNSEHIPTPVALLRENLLRTIVLGEVRKLDYFASSANTRLLWNGSGLGVVAEARGYEVVLSGRTYKFGRLKGGLLRDWNRRVGRFTLSAEDVLWYKAGLDEKDDNTTRRILHKIIHYPGTLFASLQAAVEQPASLLDLEVTSGEIIFRKFRDRDHSLEKHAMQFFGEKKPEWMNAATLQKFMVGAASQVLFGTNCVPLPDIRQGTSNTDEMVPV